MYGLGSSPMAERQGQPKEILADTLALAFTLSKPKSYWGYNTLYLL